MWDTADDDAACARVLNRPQWGPADWCPGCRQYASLHVDSRLCLACHDGYVLRQFCNFIHRNAPGRGS